MSQAYIQINNNLEQKTVHAFLTKTVFSFTPVVRVVTQCYFPLTAAHSSSAFLSLN